MFNRLRFNRNYGLKWYYTDWQNSLVTDSEYSKVLSGLSIGTEYAVNTQPRLNPTVEQGLWSASDYFTTIIAALARSYGYIIG